MGLKGIINKRAQKNAEELKRILEEDLSRLVWELNFRLLSEQGLHERILWVDMAEVTLVSVRETKQSLFCKMKNLFHRIWKQIGTRKWNQYKKK